MEFNSRFNIGDKVFVPINGVVTAVTVGRITIEYTDSNGIEGEELFDNYKPHRGYNEVYMCDETGIGTGSCWRLGKNIFATKQECESSLID